MRAWLVTWDWANDAAAVADVVAAILNPRWSVDRVARTVETLYARSTSTAAELAAYARMPKWNPYPAQRQFGAGITCGHNPMLQARLVSDLVVEESADGLEMIKWTEPAIYRPGQDGRTEVVRGPHRVQVKRLIRGPLSDEPIWDRTRGRFKEGWQAPPAVVRSQP